MKDVVEVPNIDSYTPTKREMEILRIGFFGQHSMISSYWINWAIDYTKSDLRKVVAGTVCNLVTYYDYCQVLQRACIDYLAKED